jgi:hypothetical protein
MAEAPVATGPLMTALIPEADERALILWDRYNEQKGNCERLESGPATQAQCQASYDALFAIEKLLQADIAVLLHALAAVLVIEIGRRRSRGRSRLLARLARRDPTPTRRSSQRPLTACWRALKDGTKRS